MIVDFRFYLGWTTQLVIAAVEEGFKNGWIEESGDLLQCIQGFLSDHGRAFYNVERRANAGKQPRITLRRKGGTIPETIANGDRSIEVAPFKGGDEIMNLDWD